MCCAAGACIYVKSKSKFCSTDCVRSEMCVRYGMLCVCFRLFCYDGPARITFATVH